MRALYTVAVRLKRVLCVLAKDEVEAKALAAENHDADVAPPSILDVSEPVLVTNHDALPQKWADTEPVCDYYVEMHGTCRDYLERWMEEERRRVAKAEAEARQVQLDLGGALERRVQMWITLSERIQVSLDRKACVTKTAACPHYKYTEATNGHSCALFDATLHEDVDGRPGRCEICRRLGH